MSEVSHTGAALQQPSSPESDDTSLTEHAAQGDQAAFRELYHRHARPVYWIAHGLLRSAPDAEDVLQETFLVAWRRLSEVTLAGTSLLPWLATICRYQAANRRRRISAERMRTAGGNDDDLPAGIDVLQQVISADLASQILDELKEMGELDREIFVLCAVEGYDYLSAADALGVAHGTVRNRLSRVRNRLRNALSETEES